MQVWIGLIASLIAMILAIYICSRLLRNLELKWKPFVTFNDLGRFDNSVKYTIAVILAQGLIFKM